MPGDKRVTVTREIVAAKLSDYLGHRFSLAQLVDWAEEAMQDQELDEQHLEAIRDVLARLGGRRARPGVGRVRGELEPVGLPRAGGSHSRRRVASVNGASGAPRASRNPSLDP